MIITAVGDSLTNISRQNNTSLRRMSRIAAAVAMNQKTKTAIRQFSNSN